MSKGHLIVVEGIDGSGKSTQVSLLTEWLDSLPMNVVMTKQPGASALGATLREIVLHEEMAPLTRQLIMVADRYEHCLIINEWLDRGITVVCDRYYHSMWAVGLAQGLSRNQCHHLHEVVKPLLREPDLTMVMGLAPEVAIHRMKRNDLIEAGGLELLEKMEPVYRLLADSEDNSVWLDIYEEDGPLDVFAQVKGAVLDHIEEVARLVRTST